MAGRLILKKEKYKNNNGFTVIECVVAICILALVCGTAVKAFGVAAKINTSVYEKDRANIEAVNALEDIKKDTIGFIKDKKNNEAIEYYDSKWNKVDEKKAIYEIKSKVSGDTNRVNFDGLEPGTSMEKRRYNATFMGKYLGALIKNCLYDGSPGPWGPDKETPYLFYVVYYLDEKEYEKDWNKVEGMDKGFKDYLSSGSKSDNYSYKSDKALYDFFNAVREKKDDKHTADGNKRSNCNVYRVYEVKDSVSVRVDFTRESKKNEYNIDAYNMADKPMNLYMVHSEGNNSMLKVTANGGYINEVELDSNKDIAKTLYTINVEVNKIKSKTTLIKKQTQKYIRYDKAMVK